MYQTVKFLLNNGSGYMELMNLEHRSTTPGQLTKNTYDILRANSELISTYGTVETRQIKVPISYGDLSILRHGALANFFINHRNDIPLWANEEDIQFTLQFEDLF